MSQTDALSVLEQASTFSLLKLAVDGLPAEWETICQAGMTLSKIGELANWGIGYLMLKCTKHFEPPDTDVAAELERKNLPSVTKMAEQVGVSRAHAYLCLRVVMRVPHEWADHHLPWSLKALASSYDVPARVLEIAEEGNLSYRQVRDLLLAGEEEEDEPRGEERWRERFKGVTSRNAWLVWRIFSERLEYLGLLADLRQEVEGMRRVTEEVTDATKQEEGQGRGE